MYGFPAGAVVNMVVCGWQGGRQGGGLWWALRRPVGQRKAGNCIGNDESRDTLLTFCSVGPPWLLPYAPWVTFLPSVPVDRFTFPALEEDVIYDDVPCESPDAHQPGMASCGSFPGLSLGQGERAMLGEGGVSSSPSVPSALCPHLSHPADTQARTHHNPRSRQTGQGSVGGL